MKLHQKFPMLLRLIGYPTLGQLYLGVKSVNFLHQSLPEALVLCLWNVGFSQTGYHFFGPVGTT